MVKLVLYLDFLLNAVARPRLWMRKVDYLFLMSHMRSRSTLLSHILGSHPEITGYREFLRNYRSLYGFMRLRYWTLKELQWKNPRFIQDKILHKPYTPEPEIFKKFNVRSIVFIREPLGTIRSIISMGRKTGEENHRNPVWATEYYCNRVNELRDLADALHENSWIYFDSEEVVLETTQLLNKIESFLKLNESLNAEYKKFEGTGIGGLGDPSKNIHAGKILQLDKNRNADIQIDDHLLEKANQVYQDTGAFLKNHPNQFKQPG